MSKTKSRTWKIPPNSVILFQGDSITDCGRNYANNDSLGQGYAMMISSWYSALYPEKNVRFINRGKNGDRVRELKNRWRKDCLDLRPDTVSILIGINDVLRKNFWNKSTSAEDFETDYRCLLEQVKYGIHANLVILHPFLLDSMGEICPDFRKSLILLSKVVEHLSEEFDAVLIPLNTLFYEASLRRESSFWTSDGVHPTLPGHALIAQSWLRILLKETS
jgi:acyl-CoA thioesterase I